MQGQKENSWVMKPNYDLVHSSKSICILFTFADASLHNGSAWQSLFQNNRICYKKMLISHKRILAALHPTGFTTTCHI